MASYRPDARELAREKEIAVKRGAVQRKLDKSNNKVLQDAKKKLPKKGGKKDVDIKYIKGSDSGFTSSDFGAGNAGPGIPYQIGTKKKTVFKGSKYAPKPEKPKPPKRPLPTWPRPKPTKPPFKDGDFIGNPYAPSTEVTRDSPLKKSVTSLNNDPKVKAIRRRMNTNQVKIRANSSRAKVKLG